VFWDKDGNNADWVKQLSGAALKQAMTQHVNDVVGKTKGM